MKEKIQKIYKVRDIKLLYLSGTRQTLPGLPAGVRRGGVGAAF